MGTHEKSQISISAPLYAIKVEDMINVQLMDGDEF